MSFLKAEWRKLAIANYLVDPKFLEAYLPAGTELDLWNERCYLSLVGFRFVNTRILGVKIPFHVNFEEANLRFYVKRFENGAWKRGVVFIKEIVPKRSISFVANTAYGEHYEKLPMTHRWEVNETTRTVEYQIKKQKRWHKFAIHASLLPSQIAIGSEEEFITEHYWGYARVNDRKTNAYEVTHPKWECYHVHDYEIDIDYGVLYGPQFSFLNDLEPASVMLAEGSEITVEGKLKIAT